MKSRDDLYAELYSVLDDLNYDKKLIKSISNMFTNKGFATNRPQQIISRNIPLESLSNKELLMFVGSLYKVKSSLKINPEDYFSNAEIISLNNLTKQSQKNDELILNNVVQIDDLHWICPFMTLEEIHNAHNNAFLSYNFNTQREATYKETTTGELIVTATLNVDSVRDISKSMYENKFTPNMITLNVRLLEGKKPNIKYDEKTRQLIIEPDYDYESDNTTFIDILDGFHRINGALWSVAKAKDEGKELKGGLVVSITAMTEEEAKNYIAREAQRNDMSKEYVTALSDDDYNKVIRQLNDYGTELDNILKNKIGNTINDVKFNNKYTTIEFMRKGLEETKLDIKDMFEVKMFIPKVTEITTMLIRYATRRYYNNDVNELSEKSNLLEPGMFIGYLAIANELKNDKNYFDKVTNIVDYLMNMTRNEYQDLGVFQLKNLKSKKIYSYFKELVNNI